MPKLFEFIMEGEIAYKATPANYISFQLTFSVQGKQLILLPSAAYIQAGMLRWSEVIPLYISITTMLCQAH